MNSSTLTSKGQTTIPKDIRDALSLKPSDELVFTLLSSGSVVMTVRNKPLGDLAGAWSRASIAKRKRAQEMPKAKTARRRAA